MDIPKEFVKAINTVADAIIKASKDNKAGSLVFQRTHSITTINKANITAVHITATTVTVNTTDGLAAFYAVIGTNGNTDYLAALATLAQHDYYIPSFAAQEPNP